MLQKVEIDQSVRVDKAGDTFVALANETSYTIKIPSVVEEAGRLALRERGIPPKLINPLLWAGRVFLLIKPYLSKFTKEISHVVIDNEFDGHENTIKAAILRHIHAYYKNFPEDKLKIDSVGKKSSAHKLAWTTRRKKRGQADATISVRGMIELLGK